MSFRFTIADDWVKPRYSREVKKHAGPGSHPGTGSSQSAHAGGKKGKQIHAKSKELVKAIVTQGGFTYNVYSDESPDKGFSVAPFTEAERVFSFMEFARQGRQILDDYIDAHEDLLQKDHAYLGGWYDEEANKVYLDVPIVLDSRREAIQLAKDNDQEAIFDLATFETIIVKEEAQRRKRKGGPPIQAVMVPLSALRTREQRERFAAAILGMGEKK